MTKQEIVEFTKNNIENSINEDEELNGTKVDFILINPNNNDTISIISDGQEKIVEFTPYTKEMKTGYSHISEWAYNFDEYLFQELENGYEIGYMSADNHYGVWNSIKELYPEDINYKDGVQWYLQYCVDNGITKEYLDEKTNLDTPDIMKYFKGLALHETMTYKGYVIEADDTNYDNSKENIVNIYKCQEDFNENKINETISLNTINLKENIKEYIDDVYIDKTDLESEKSYITFVLGYDLLHDMINKFDVLECDINYDFCNDIASQFLDSEEYSNASHSSYEMLQKWLSKNMNKIEQEYKEKIGFEDKIYNGNMIIINKGFRKNEPIALVEKTINGSEKEYIVAFYYKENENKLSWGYAYYYDNDRKKAETDYNKVINGGNLAHTFDREQER